MKRIVVIFALFQYCKLGSTDKWDGKNAMVTGANSGIGAAVTGKLLDLGFSVIGLDKRTENLMAMKKYHAKGKNLHVLKVDLIQEKEVMKAFEWAEESIGGIDVLVNSAGIGGISNLLDGSVEEWRNMLNVNVVALCLCSKEAIKSMQKRNVGGHIIHLGSNAGHNFEGSLPEVRFYAATKHAVKALTEGLRQELKQANSPVKVTSISPGIVKTPFSKILGEEKEKLLYENNTFLNAEDIANAVQYILETPPPVQVHDLHIKPWKSRL